jgi:lipopolysaccharide biosynthesis regulator YciM
MMSVDSTTTYLIAAILVVGAFAIALTVTLHGGRARRRRSREDPYVAGLRLLLDGDRAGAYASLQKSIKSGKAPTDAYIRLGALLRENGDPGKALQMHRSLTVKTDLSRREKIELFANIAQDYSAQGNAAQAASVLETAVSSMGLKEPDVYRQLAREYHILGNTQSSYRCLKDMKRLGALGERELSLYLCTVGEGAVDQGDLKEAKKLFHRALKHKPDNAVALLALGNLEEKLDNENEALERWKAAATQSPELSGEALKKVEHVMFHRGTFGDIETVYRSILEARPWDEYATLALASFYKKQGRGEDAIEFLEEYRNMHPGSIGATVLLTSLYAAHDESDALETFLEELEARSSEPTERYECAACGFHSPAMRWHCPRCNSFDSFTKKHEV